MGQSGRPAVPPAIEVGKCAKGTTPCSNSSIFVVREILPIGVDQRGAILLRQKLRGQIEARLAKIAAILGGSGC